MSGLEDRVKNDAGINIEFVRQVNKLEEIKQLVEAGKVKPEVYKKLEDAVFKTQKDKEKQAATSQSGIQSGLSNMRNMVKKAVGMSPKDKLKEDEGSPGKNSTKSRAAAIRSRTDSNKSAVSVKSDVKRKAKDVVVFEGELFKFVRKKDKKEWRQVYMVLFPDKLDFKSAKDGKILKSIPLTEDFFVSFVDQGIVKRAFDEAESDDDSGSNNQRQEEAAELMTSSLAKSEELLSMNHVFVIANITQTVKIFMACDTYEKRNFWVLMLVEVLREMRTDIDAPPKGKKGQKVWEDYENRTAKFVEEKIVKKLNGNLENVDSEEIDKDLKKWKKNGQSVAQQMVTQEWLARETSIVDEVMKVNQQLNRELENKSKQIIDIQAERALDKQKFEAENQKKIESLEKKVVDMSKKYDDLMEKYRAEALQRNNERKGEEERLKKRMNALQRRSVVPSSEESLHYKNEYEKLKLMLETLQKALNVNLDEMDWDGTLEQAEQRMQECLKDIMEGATPQIQNKAQSDFDKWDQLVRGHKDYIAREDNKWKSWEEENFEKNRDALNEMRELYVPEVYKVGCSVQDLMDIKNIPKKTAERIVNNKVFKFFWMDKESISKLHSAALINQFSSPGLDLRELRAVYACLPEEFQNDADGKKKAYRDNIRSRLAALTEKEAKGTLLAAEERNNAYRDKDVNTKVQPALPAIKHERQATNKLKNQAAALEAFFNKQVGGAAAAKPAASATESAKEVPSFDPAAPEWQKYVKMMKMNMPDGAIKQKMIQDGKNPDLWEQIKTGGSSAVQNPTAAFDASSPEWKPYLKMKDMGLEEGAIKNKMVKDGKDPSLWDKLNASSSKEKVTEPSKPEVIELNDPAWAPYFKMKKMGLGDGVIMNKLQQDGKDPAIWTQLMELKAKEETEKTPNILPESLQEFNFLQKKPEELKPSPTTLSGTSDGDPKAAELPQDSSTEEALKRAMKKLQDESQGEKKKPRKKKKSKKFSESGVPAEAVDPEEEEVEASIKKKKRNPNEKRNGSKTLHQGDASDYLNKAKLDTTLNLENVKGGVHALGALKDYNDIHHSNSNTRQSVHDAKGGRRRTLRQSKVGTGALQTDSALQQVVDYILTDGTFDSVEGGARTMKFGDVFDNFIDISDVLVGLLLKGKKAGQLKYQGDMLFKGIHDEVKITVL